jgi:hypothetical protein
MLIALSLLSVGCFNVTLGKDDGIAPVNYDETFTDLPDLAQAPDGAVDVPTKAGEVIRATRHFLRAPDRRLRRRQGGA